MTFKFIFIHLNKVICPISRIVTKFVAHIKMLYGALGVFLDVCIKIVFIIHYMYIITYILVHILALYMYVYCGYIDVVFKVLNVYYEHVKGESNVYY
jgi:hypothetical protein